MLNPILTKAVEFGDRHERPITIAAGVWFAISCASWIPWMPIPDIPYLTDSKSWMLSGAWNAGWWGFVHPMLEKRREEMRAAEQPQRISASDPSQNSG